MTKRILFIAPSSFPPNNPEAYVNAKQIKLLADAGFKIDLICGRIANAYPQEDDKTLFKNVHKIVYIPLSRKRNIQNLWHHFLVYIQTGYIYKGINWVNPALKQCKKLIKTYKYDYIFTKDYPSEVIGVYLAKKYKLKWVATWNDPYMWKKYPAPYGKGINARISYWRKKLIRDIGKYSFKNLFPSNRLRDYMLKYMTGMESKSCVIIPHVLLNDITGFKFDSIKNDILKIIYAGSLGKERDPSTFLYGIADFHKKNPDVLFKIDLLTFFERTDQKRFKYLIDKLALNDIVCIHPPVKYKESLKIISQYDICLIIEAPCAEGIFLPSKVIDYFQCKKAIWSISPACGVLADMYKNKLIDYFSDVTNSHAISETMTKIVTDHTIEGRIVNKEYPKEFTAKQILHSLCKEVLV